jgi:hypothetical protein
MTANTGRTVSRFVNFIVGDSSDVLRNIPVDSVNGVGLTYDEMNVTAFQDAIKNALLGHPSCTISITGPFDTTAAAASPSLSGSHTVLSALVGVNTPRSLDVQVGIRHAWEAGEPQFGITKSATSGFIVSEYVPDINNGKYSAKLVVFGSTAPAWGTAAET